MNAARWTIAELSAQAAVALSVDHAGPPDGRTREVPDSRTIRYYTTLGLLDRPAEMRGRTALYGRRHLMQLVAIKRLQARGQSLAEIQRQLIGLPPAALARIAKLPSVEESSETSERAARSFWKEAPATSTETALAGDVGPSVPWQGVPLNPEVILLLRSSRAIEEDDLASLRVAAAPLLKVLETRRLARPQREEGTS
jgi:DNA-binding transcriptional MerR regulator